MPVSFGSYEIARSGLFVNERGLYVTGHNISNVNTPGYVRQQAMIATAQYQRDGKFQFGLGADIEQIRQIRHVFLDNVYRQESTTLGYWEARNKTFQDVQAILGEPMGSGLQNVVNQFWDSWQELSKEPDSLTVRALVRQRAGAFVQQVNHVGDQLDRLQSDLNSEIGVRVDEINQITGQIGKLNVEILKVEISKDTANDYRDQRNQLVDRLSKLVDADVTEMQDGQLAITVGGYFIVNKGLNTKMYAEERQTGSMFYVPKLVGSKIEVPIRSGTLKGLMESRGEVTGSEGSPSNGSPSTKADITFVLDVSNGSTANLDKIKAYMRSYLNELNEPGVDYNLRVVTYKSGAVIDSNVWDKTNVGANFNNFMSNLNAIANEDGTDYGNDFDDVTAKLDSIAFRPDANRYALVFTGESIDGDGSAVADLSACINTLKGKEIKASIITDAKYQNNGDSVSESGWQAISYGTGGKLYDLNSTDYGDLMGTLALNNVNYGISYIKETANIIPDLKKGLNAIVNIIAREINFMHSSGKTLRGQQGGDFFSSINSAYPIEMGNIKLNDNLTSGITDLNNIVASASGASGDNTIALRIANLRNMPEMQDVNGATSLDDYYQSIILRIGNGGSEAQRIAQNQQNLVTSADNYRKSITGVSMDEEMSNMMKYKFAYDAASRVMNVIDEMLDTVINRAGIVGR